MRPLNVLATALSFRKIFFILFFAILLMVSELDKNLKVKAFVLKTARRLALGSTRFQQIQKKETKK